MQDGITNIPQWMQSALIAVASLLSGIGIDKLYNTWLNRKKPSAEVELTQATATEVTIRASSSAGDAVMRMIDKLTEAQTTIDRLRRERDSWQDEYAKVFGELGDSRQANRLLQSEIDNYENQIRTMRATLTMAEKNYDGTQNVKRGDYQLPDRETQD